MAVTASRAERITPSLTIQAPLTGDHGPGLVIVTLAGAPTPSIGDPQHALAQEGYTVAHLRLPRSWGEDRIRDELREATDSLDFHKKCSDKSRYGIIGNAVATALAFRKGLTHRTVYTPESYPYLIEAVDGNGEINAAVFMGEIHKPCRKAHLLIAAQEDSKGLIPDDALKFLRR